MLGRVTLIQPRLEDGLAWWSVRRAVHGVLAAARRDRDAALLGLLDGPAVWAFELGRLIPNRPRPRLRPPRSLERLASLRLPQRR